MKSYLSYLFDVGGRTKPVRRTVAKKTKKATGSKKIAKRKTGGKKVSKRTAAPAGSAHTSPAK